ncbi:MAG: 50S ribosomal protein L17, partial [Cytophagales bacterium]
MSRSSRKRKAICEPGPRRVRIRNQINSLFTHKRIQTTLGQAKKLRPIVEPIITGFRKRAVKNFDHACRMAFRSLHNKETVKILVNDIGPAVGDRNGGYLRIIRVGTRKGDGAEMAETELVDFNPTYKKGLAKRSTTRRRRKKSKSTPASV